MPRKFNDGDYVGIAGNLVKTNFMGVPHGTVGRVVGFYASKYYLVTFDEITDRSRLGQLHSGNAICKYSSPTCQWFEASHLLALAAPTPKHKVDFETVIISDDKRKQILEALAQIDKYGLIFDSWGFGKTIEKGRGASMLFYGPPGTGKTLVCQAIASHLDKPLLVISTADIESSAPGEAERNIRKAFKEAKSNKSILLFDECDSLIYSRQSVGPILGAQINELLSQLEKHEGITLFTTNRLGTLDDAVNRRLALKLELGMPTREQRVEIWKRMFPKEAPLSRGIDWNRLAGPEVTGGYIKNAVLRAARMAAIQDIPDEEKKIRMTHLVQALTQEIKAMIEFEKARGDHKSGIGQVGTNSQGERIIQPSGKFGGTLHG